MKIGIDGNEANVHKQVGVSVYTLSLLKHFAQIAKEQFQFRIYLKKSPNDLLPPESDYFKYKVIHGKFFWSQIFLPYHLYIKRDIDVFFSPAHYTPRLCPTPLVVTIHDLSYLYYPDEFLRKDLYKLQHWTKHAIEQSAKIIAVSKNTKRDIMKHYQVPEDKIEVIYNGFEKSVLKNSRLNEEETLKNYNLQPTTYLLYVGTLQPRKNILTLIDAFHKLWKQIQTYKLVIVGKKGWLYEEIFTKVQELNLQEQVVFTDYLPDDQLVALYKNAFCFILPSLYEGFGIPVLEAMSFSCPVITSFASSLPEIGGDACLYFDPHSSDDLVEKIQRLRDDTALRKDLIKKGRERIKQFSWEKCADETLNVIQQAVNM